MANIIRIKRRDSGGSAGAPASLENAELAFNEADDTLYYGKGTGGAGGTATTIEAIGGKGAYVSLGAVNQSIGGTKTFTGTVVAPTVSAADNSTNVATTAFVKAQGYITSSGTVASADKLTTARSIALTTDATGSANFDGTANINIAVTLANSGVSAGTWTKVTVDAKGRVTVGANLSASDIPTLTASKISDFDTQVRTSRLDQMAAPTADVSLNSRKITGLADPTSDTDAANKRYVDTAVQGLKTKNSVRAATTANITLSGTQTIDGVALIAGDRVLVKNQTTPAQNGIYVVAAGAWSRATDADAWAELVSAFVFVEQGTTNSDNGFVCTVDAGGTLGTTSVTFAQFSGAGSVSAGAGLTQTGNQIDVGAGTGITVAADTVGLSGQALALHNLATNGIIVRTGSGTVTARTITASGTGINVTNGDGVSAAPDFTLNASLSSIGGLTPAADRLPYYTGAAAASLATFTSFGRSLVDDADAAAARTTLGLRLGIDVMEYSTQIYDIQNLTPTDSNIIVGNGTTWVAESGATARTSLGLTIGTDVQAHSAFLTTIAGLARTDGNFIVGNGTTWVAESGATARTSLGLGSIATQAASSVAITGGSITNLTTFDGITIDCGTF